MALSRGKESDIYCYWDLRRRKTWREKLLNKKWLNINEKIVYAKVTL
jgi:hypothetical protein